MNVLAPGYGRAAKATPSDRPTSLPPSPSPKQRLAFWESVPGYSSATAPGLHGVPRGTCNEGVVCALKVEGQGDLRDSGTCQRKSGIVLVLGGLFCVAYLVSPRYGLIPKLWKARHFHKESLARWEQHH